MVGKVYAMVGTKAGVVLGQCLAEPGSYREERWLGSMKRQGAVISVYTEGAWREWLARDRN